MKKAKVKRVIAAALFVGGILLFAAVALSTRASNCGGNSAALTACAAHVINLESWCAEHPRFSPFHQGLSAEQKSQLFDLPGASWLGDAKLLVNPKIQSIDPAGQRRIALVCDRPYRNVPRYTAWLAQPQHAVAYSTGETGLISSAEFAQLDRREFIDLRRLYVSDGATPGSPKIADELQAVSQSTTVAFR